ncbi:hypothetical protein L1987_34299 [Smallanthus sonchifolius]|uniref:Uncharacterized protein n=1 Tax=Smallanthus sonchifolius TaxID=185202 RepID=A0ACB9HU54_9ASTR|nr:hypothetical protein L1987_34299 [Smallanthus sonchifolius]
MKTLIESSARHRALQNILSCAEVMDPSAEEEYTAVEEKVEMESTKQAEEIIREMSYSPLMISGMPRPLQLADDEKLHHQPSDTLKANYKKYELIDGAQADGTVRRLVARYGTELNNC